MRNLSTYGTIPITPDIIAESLPEYASPKDRISRLEQDGQLIRIRNGLYVVSPGITNQNIVLEVVANQLYGPSYISYESALSHYGLIPERVYTVRSACLNRGKRYNTPLGNFEFTRVHEQYYPIGLQHIIAENEYAYLIATPEKALCDLIIGTSGLRIQSVSAMREYLFEDLRIDEDYKKWNTNIIAECVRLGRKRSTLNHLLNLLQNG